jgi:DNA-binding CsgD family transcriptional regulator
MKLPIMKLETNRMLSKRELTILELVASGNNSEQIGKVLTISKTTVQTHRRNMLKKTGMNNTQQLVSWGYREKLLK